MEKLPISITPDMIEQANQTHKKVEAFELFDSENNSLGFALFGRPSSNVIAGFERYVDKDSFKARGILINGSVCLKEHKDIINSWEKNSEEYAAAFDAASKMLPVGKAEAKKV